MVKHHKYQILIIVIIIIILLALLLANKNGFIKESSECSKAFNECKNIGEAKFGYRLSLIATGKIENKTEFDDFCNKWTLGYADCGFLTSLQPVAVNFPGTAYAVRTGKSLVPGPYVLYCDSSYNIVNKDLIGC